MQYTIRAPFIIPPTQRSCWGVYWFHSVRPSVRPHGKLTVLLEDLLRCWKINGRSMVLLEDQLYWRQSTGLDGNYRSRKITERRWLHKYVRAECGASSFTWYLYQICNTEVRPSVRPASRVRSVAPRVLVGSISYLYILSNNFLRCVTCKVYCKILKFEYLAIF